MRDEFGDLDPTKLLRANHANASVLYAELLDLGKTSVVCSCWSYFGKPVRISCWSYQTNVGSSLGKGSTKTIKGLSLTIEKISL